MIIAIIITTIKNKTRIITHKDHVTTVENSDISPEIVEKAEEITTVIIKIVITSEIMKLPK